MVSAAACCRTTAKKRLQIKEIPFSLFPVLFLGGRRHDIAAIPAAQVSTMTTHATHRTRPTLPSYNCIAIKYCTQSASQRCAHYYMHIAHNVRHLAVAEADRWPTDPIPSKVPTPPYSCVVFRLQQCT